MAEAAQDAASAAFTGTALTRNRTPSPGAELVLGRREAPIRVRRPLPMGEVKGARELTKTHHALKSQLAVKSRRARGRPGGFEFGDFFIREYAAARQKPHAFRRLHRKPGAAPGHDVDDELGVPPILELRGADVKLAAGNLAQQHILRSNAEIARGIAHRRRPVAAAPGLVEHQSSVLALDPRHHLGCPVRDLDAIDHYLAPCS